MKSEYAVIFPEDQFHTLANLLQLICVAGLEFHGTGSALPTKEALAAVWKTMALTLFKPSGDKAPLASPHNVELREAVRRLLHYSWRDIFFEYDKLTSQEKTAITEEQFNQLKDWARPGWE